MNTKQISNELEELSLYIPTYIDAGAEEALTEAMEELEQYKAKLDLVRCGASIYCNLSSAINRMRNSVLDALLSLHYAKKDKADELKHNPETKEWMQFVSTILEA